MAFNPKDYHNELLFVPLGGANEIGMNLNLYHYQGKWLMVDFGIGFSDPQWTPGVDVIVPNVEFLRQIKNDIVGLILTHAHEDHLGAAPYLWHELNCPVYATPFTASYLLTKLAGENIQPAKNIIKEVQLGATLQLGPFSVEFIGLTHSIPEMQALAIGTEKGVVMHTGDWKFDPDPLVGAASDQEALFRYGEAGVLAMVCDSTNVFVEGRSGSEAVVRDNLVERIRQCKGRVFVTTFASNVARLETLTQAAFDTGRKIVLAGRSLWRITDAAREAGYLKGVEFLTEDAVNDIPRDKLMVICTGCQGEPMAALSKMARGDHQNLRFVPSDTVIFSARMIPGNEKRISHVQNQIVRNGIEIITPRGDDIHVSGHPAREELAEMYAHIRPHVAVPVHGEARHLKEHAAFAKSLQVPVAIEPYNGAVIQLSREKSGIIGQVTSGYVAVDGDSLLDVDSPVLRMRRRLQEAGIVTVVLALNKHFELLAAPSITAPGSLDPEDDVDLLEMLKEEVEIAMDALPQVVTDDKVKQNIRTAIRRVFKKEVGKKPIIFVELIKLK